MPSTPPPLSPPPPPGRAAEASPAAAPGCRCTPEEQRLATAWLQQQFDAGLQPAASEDGEGPLLRRLPQDVVVREPLDLQTARCFGNRDRRHLAQLAMLPSPEVIEQMESGHRYVDPEEAARLSAFCHHPVRSGYHHPPVEVHGSSAPWHVYSALQGVGMTLGDAFSAVAMPRAEARAFLRFEAPLSRRSARALTALIDAGRSGGPHHGPSARALRESRRARRITPERAAEHCRLTLAEYLGMESGHRSVEEIHRLMSSRSTGLLAVPPEEGPAGPQQALAP